MTICKVTEFDYNILMQYPVVVSPAGKKEPRIYCGCINCFDIESTNLKDIEQSVMYAWKLAIDEDHIIAGRTWEEYQMFIEKACSTIPDGIRLVIYVHNLSYEWAFLCGQFDFASDDVFAVDKRKILKCTYRNKIEYRCSYLWSNMGLHELTNKYNVRHKKLSGKEYDYDKPRFYFTPLTEKEEQYQINDVLGVVESIKTAMRLDGDDLCTIPLTSTGYPRRDMREALKPVYGLMKWMLPQNSDLYRMLRAAFRGGNAHANRFIVGDQNSSGAAPQIIEDVESVDEASAYPAVMLNEKFPMTRFKTYTDKSKFSEFHLRDEIRRGNAIVAHITLKNVRLKSRFWEVPYISYDRCTDLPIYETQYNGKLYRITGYQLDNGRVMQADVCSMAITDIDLAIIDSEYEYDELIVHNMYFAKYKKLPKEFRDVVKKYYADKTLLKDAETEEEKVYYQKLKALLNALFGMTCQDIMKEDILYDLMDPEDAAANTKTFYTKSEQLYYAWEKENQDASDTDKLYKRIEIRRIILEELLDEYHKGKGWLPYQIGVWVTAHARLMLERGLHYIHQHTDYMDHPEEKRGDCYFLYCDTDSLKYHDKYHIIDWDKFNEFVLQKSVASGGVAEDRKGNKHYLGIFDREKPATRFIALGAKKYLYQYADKRCVKCPHFKAPASDPFTCSGKIAITIAGVGKKDGAAYLAEQGGLEAFVAANTGKDSKGRPRGFVFPPHGGGGTLAKYNDAGHEPITVDGHVVEIPPNVYLGENFKTVKRGADYFDLTVSAAQALNSLLTDVEIYLNSIDKNKYL